MNEFQQKPKDQLKIELLVLLTYRQACIDMFEIIEDNHKKSIEFYNQKIYQCEKDQEREE